MEQERHRYPAFDIPIAVVPASIDNNLPGWPMAVGADTALNTVVDAIDMVRMSASASKRAFIVETMGRGCGFLPLVGGIAAGAEKSYLPELGINLTELEEDIAALVDAFDTGRNFYLAVVGENASEHYTTDVLRRLFEAEGQGSSRCVRLSSVTCSRAAPRHRSTGSMQPGWPTTRWCTWTVN